MDRLREMLADDLNDDKSQSSGSKKKSGGGLFDNPGDVYGTPDGRIVVTAKSVKRGLERASEVLDEGIVNLDYEILEHGSAGFLGFGSKPYKIVVGVVNESVPATSAADFEFEMGASELGNPSVQKPVDRDGYAKVVVRKTGIFLAIHPPVGKGRKADMVQANNALLEKGINGFDQDNLAQLVDEASGEPVKIGEWQPNSQYDSRAQITISNDEMQAFCSVKPPIKWGRVLEVEDILNQLDFKGVKFGLRKDKIQEMLDNEIYNQLVVVAEGKPVEAGRDAVIDYKFRTSEDEVELKEVNGRVDYRNQDNIANVVMGQVLATKEPASKGVPGRTVTNKKLETEPGKDVQLIAGKNCTLSDDGLEVTSDINGQAVLENFKIEVKAVTIYEKVGIETGNVTFLGSVIVKGDVEDNAEIRAAGDIEVHGVVGKSYLEAEGDIYLRGGIHGKNSGQLKARNNIQAKFVDSAKISAGNEVIVQDGIMLATVDAGKRVLCVGAKAQISGSHVRAREEVAAKQLGSRGSTETIIEVGIDPKSRAKLKALEDEKREKSGEKDKKIKDILTLENQRGSGSLSPEKEEMLQQLTMERAELETRLAEVSEEINEIRSYLNRLEAEGRIAVSGQVYPGVVVVVKNSRFEVRDDFKSVTFYQEDNQIKIGKYEPPKESKKKKKKKQ